MKQARVVTALLLVVLGACSRDMESRESADPPMETRVTVNALLASGRPIVLAHAGGENAHPHSVAFSYGESMRAGVDVLDFDVRLTRDGVLVVHHDEDVDRTTEGTGKVSELSYAELSALDNAYWFTATCTCRDQPESAYVYRGIRTGQRGAPAGYSPEDFAVPKFADVIDRYPNVVLNVEIKGSFGDAVRAAEELARILRDRRRMDQAVVTAFDDELAESFHRVAPEVAITPGLKATTAYVLAGTVPPSGRTILQVPPEYEGTAVLTPTLVEHARRDGLVLWIWPNDRSWETSEGYQRLFDMGVQGINAADPETAVVVRNLRV